MRFTYLFSVHLFAGFALLLFPGVGAPCRAQTPAPAESRPNIIFLLTDDQRADALGISGHLVLETPHIDRLARDGVRFTDAHVVAPVCMPSRVSFMNGQYERVHQIGFSSPNVLSEVQWNQTYSALLRNAGYHVGFVGKIGLQQYSFRGSPLKKFDFWRGHDDWARFWPKEFDHLAIYHDAEGEIVTPIMSESIERFLDQTPADRPFMLSVSFSAPHGSISGSMLYPDEQGLNRMFTPANTHPKLADNTIIIFSSDHGLLMGEYSMGGKSLLYDVATRVPLIVYDPRTPAGERGITIDELALSIDVPATIVSYAGLDVPQTMQGRTLRPLTENPEAVWRDEIFLESLFLMRTGPFMEAVRTKDWKYVRYFLSDTSQYTAKDVDFTGREPDFEQLFDLVNDPAEERNLIGDASQAARIAAFRERSKQYSAELVQASKDLETYPR